MQLPSYQNYKVSRFENSISIPKAWDEKRLKFVVSHNDESLPETTDPDYEIEYVDISSVDLVNGITNYETLAFEKAPSRARRIARDGDTIVSTVRTYLKAIAPINQPPENLIVSTGFVVIRPRDNIDKRYLSYFLQCHNFVESVVANSVGVSYPAINASDLVCIPVYFPQSLFEQKKSAAFLDYKTRRIDHLIEKKKSLIEKLDEKRIAVITQAVTKGIDRNAKLKPSGVDWLGNVPEHWSVRRLRFLSNERLQYGANEAAEMDDRDQPRFIRITDVNSDGTLNDDTFRSIPRDVAKPFLLSSGDILLARSGATVGKSFIYSDDWGVAAYAGYLIRFRVDQNIMDANFAYAFFQSSVFWANINSTLIQSTIQNFNAERYANIPIPLPPIEEQKKINEHLSEDLTHIDGMIGKTKNAIQLLEEYRSAIITSVVTGSIDVRDVVIPRDFL